MLGFEKKTKKKQKQKQKQKKTPIFHTPPSDRKGIADASKVGPVRPSRDIIRILHGCIGAVRNVSDGRGMWVVCSAVAHCKNSKKNSKKKKKKLGCPAPYLDPGAHHLKRVRHEHRRKLGDRRGDHVVMSMLRMHHIQSGGIFF
jgi:hypothetical protein